jgi:hypothetical protein
MSETRDRRSAGGLAHVADPAALLYGALIAASVLATASAHAEAYTHVAVATTFVLGVYWLAHVYVESQSLQLSGDGRRYLHRLGHTARGELSIIQGGLPAIVVFVVADRAGLSVGNAAAVAVYFSVAVLVGAGYLTARAAGRRGWAAVLDSAAAGLFGVLVIVAKALLH